MRKQMTTHLLLLLLAVLASVSTHAASSVTATFALAPDNNLAVLLNEISSATRSIAINIYEFDNDTVLQAVLRKIRSGTQVRILVEGEPVGNLSQSSHRTLLRIRDALSAPGAASGSWLRIMTSARSQGVRRFRYNHAKYVVVDGQSVYMASENFSAGGHAQAGLVGNRGWAVAVRSAPLARQMLALLTEDADVRHGDVVEVGAGDAIPLPVSARVSTSSPSKKGPGTPRSAPPIAAGSAEIGAVSLITSPRSDTGIQEFIRTATSHVEVEQMSLPSLWREGAAHGEVDTRPSPFVQELVAASRRGVAVRVLLNDERVFQRPEPSSSFRSGTETPRRRVPANEVTARLLNRAAKCYGIAIEGRIVDIRKAEITYIHNKGWLADRARALVSSVNGSRNSVMNNRETALWIESAAGAEYYERAFNFDWDATAPLPDSTVAEDCQGFFGPGNRWDASPGPVLFIQ